MPRRKMTLDERKKLRENKIVYFKEHPEARELIRNLRLGKTMEEQGHKPNCPCGVCKAKRGEYIGKNNPFYGKHHMEATRKSLSESHKGLLAGDNHPMKRPEVAAKVSRALMGHSVSQETRDEISRINTGRKTSDETKQKLSLIFSGEGNPMYGKTHTPEAREKMRLKALNYIETHPYETAIRIQRILKSSIYRNSRPELIMQDLLAKLIEQETINEIFQTHKIVYQLDLPGRAYHHEFDIVFFGLKLIIEVDGIHWHHNPDMHPEQMERDKLITNYITNCTDWTILRFTDEWDIYADINKVENTITSVINELNQ